VSVIAVVLTSTLAQAQASIAGVVKDASGAAIPGVTVEVASPVLIEKVRTVIGHRRWPAKRINPSQATDATTQKQV